MNVIKQTDVDIATLVKQLKDGGTIVYPTETCYGLGCDAMNGTAVERVYALKGRPKDKPLIVIAASVDMLRAFVEVSPAFEQIARKYWPGALTIVAPIKMGVVFPQGID